MWQIIQGDCLDVMKTFPDNHFSGVVTDPPYGLSFMGKGWDHAVPGIEYWKECLRITKPGGHLLAMGGTRTFHRLTCAIEDSGFEIRDCIMWIYGSGFPKSHNKFGCEGYGTALKPAHEPIMVGQKPYEINHLIAIISYDLTHEIHRNVCQRSNANVNDAEVNLKDSLALLNKALPFTVQENVKMYAWEKLADANYVARNITALERVSSSANSSSVQETVSTNGCAENLSENLILHGGAEIIFANIQDIYMSVTTSDTLENIALLWRNTLEDVLREMSRFTTRMALRLITELRTLKSCLSPIISKDTGNLSPNYEPIIMAMKPCDGTFKKNAQKWGQAGINIDGCRIASDPRKICNYGSQGSQGCISRGSEGNHSGEIYNERMETKGRWPANVILDEEAGAMLDEQSGVSKSIYSNTPQPLKTSKGCKGGAFSNPLSQHPEGHEKSAKHFRGGFTDTGGASRFFYCAKASSRERNEGLDELPGIECQTGCGGAMPIDDDGRERDRFKKIAKNSHPTVKPLALMRYLLTLISPPTNSLILDPFAGSGSTIVAAKHLNISAIGIEKQPDYCEIAKKRLDFDHQLMF